jgi:hypothetical protein
LFTYLASWTEAGAADPDRYSKGGLKIIAQ